MATPDPRQQPEAPDRIDSTSVIARWLGLAASRPVVVRALACGAIVGSILVTINHCDCYMAGKFGAECLTKSILMPIVPYLVSTISSVHALMQEERRASSRAG